MEYVDRQWKERIFSEVAGTNMTKIGKVFADLRDQLGIPYLMITDNGGYTFDPPQRLFICYGWLGEKHSAPTANRRSREKRRITKRYLHTFPLSSVS